MKLCRWDKMLRLFFSNSGSTRWNESGLVSPLSEACVMESPLLVRWLLTNGADPYGNPNESRRPLDRLASGDCTTAALACARLLLASGVDPLQFDDQALSAVQRAEMEGTDAMVAVLLQIDVATVS